jgi:hypothetical protein
MNLFGPYSKLEGCTEIMGGFKRPNMDAHSTRHIKATECG